MADSQDNRTLAWLTRGMTRAERRLNASLIQQTCRAFQRYARQRRRDERQRQETDSEGDRRRTQNGPTRELVEFLRLEILRVLEQLDRISDHHAEFRRVFSRVRNDAEARRVLIDNASVDSESFYQRWLDSRALRRWFDEEAVNDRFERRRGEAQLQLVFLLGRFGVMVGRTIPLMQTHQKTVELWDRLGIDPLVRRVLQSSLDMRVHVAAVRCLRVASEHLASSVVELTISETLVSQVVRIAMQKTTDVWLQCESITALTKVANAVFADVVRDRLTHPGPADDLFVRRHCIELAVRYRDRFGSDDPIWSHVESDPSDAVRQRLAMCLWQMRSMTRWQRIERLAVNDECPQVRAAALLGALDAQLTKVEAESFYQFLAQRLGTESNAFVRRVAMHVAVTWLKQLRQSGKQPTEQECWPSTTPVIDCLATIRRENEHIPSRRWAAEATEWLWLLTNEEAWELYSKLQPRLAPLGPGQSARVPRKWLRRHSTSTVGRVLSVLAQNDLGLELTRTMIGYRITKGPTFGIRGWRIWHEFWSPATDKRQAKRHTIGRTPHGSLRAPSRIMGELSETKVPGEPLVLPSDGTWRPFLPLADDLVAAVNRSWFGPRTTELFTSEGVTTLRASWNPLRRLCGGLRMVTSLPRLAALRNWDEQSQHASSDFVTRSRDCGVHVTFRPHSDKRGRPIEDTSVTRFFPALVVFGNPALGPYVWDQIRAYSNYFGSAFENTLEQLVLFSATALGLFLLRHAIQNLLIWRSRSRISLSIGGWGTRGKSGTERLKAALLTAAGYPLVSKTTGCEAMFIQSSAFGMPLEIPLYRPGDKATIWEQANLLRFATRLKPNVFLWECMGLTPDYVDVLQRQWTRDDLATITNTYPDHEDLQGPSGYDVAATISGFVPERAHLITTEQQMLPLLEARCRDRKTSLRRVSWLDSQMITDDLLARFPYEEHPDNIALVATLGDELGFSFDESVKAMADQIIADLGVLKTHPPAPVQSCVLEFSNGMSANERFGCLGNWRRLGFDRQDAYADVGTWLTTVVNNRADRVARSRVFANILVNDISADRHVLIGGNLKGLQGFIWEAWSDYERRITLCKTNGTWQHHEAHERLQQLARRLRIFFRPDHVIALLHQMMANALSEKSPDWLDRLTMEHWSNPSHIREILRQHDVTAGVADRIVREQTRRLEELNEFRQLESFVRGAKGEADQRAVLEQVRKTVRQWFARKLVLVENYAASGDQIIQRIVTETPPGVRNRVMGLQNIKGTGLDFVYRFHAWDACHAACELLTSTDSDARSKGIALLESVPDFGLLGRQTVAETIQMAKQAHPPLTSDQQLRLLTIHQRLSATSPDPADISEGQSSRNRLRPWLNAALRGVEQWMETADSVRRRRQADQIYRDLAAERIGRQRAVEELRKLNKRQKGGWLANRLWRSS